MEKIKRDLKKYLSDMILLLSIISLFFPFMDDIEKKNLLMLYTFRPFIVLFILTIFNVLSVHKDMHKLHNITSIMMMFLYFYIFMWIKGSTYKNFDLRSGTFLLILSFLIFTINLFVKFPAEKEKERSRKSGENEKMITDPINIEEKYILANYSSGLEEDIKQKSNLSIIMSKDTEDEIYISIYSKNPYKKAIKMENIVEVEIKTKNWEKPKFEWRQDREEELAYIQASMLTFFGAFIGSNKLVEDIENYVDLEVDSIYEVVLVFKEGDLEIDLAFETKIDPTSFFKNRGIAIVN